LKAYGYLRCSHADSEQSGLGLAAQQDRVRAYYDLLKMRLAQQGVELEWGGLLIDKVVSAWNKPLLKRPQGIELHRLLEAGDHVLFARLDRGFRNVKDFCTVVPFWAERGVVCHFVDQMLDMSTANGRFMAQVLAAIAEWESSIKSERIREALKAASVRGRFLRNRKPPRGWKLIGRGRYAKLVPDKILAVLSRFVKYCHNHKKMSFWQIADAAEILMAKREKREPTNRFHRKVYTSRWSFDVYHGKRKG